MKAVAGPSGGARSTGAGTGRIGGIEGAPRSAGFSSRSLAAFSPGKSTESKPFSYIAPGARNKNATPSIFRNTRILPDIAKPTQITPDVHKKALKPAVFRTQPFVPRSIVHERAGKHFDINKTRDFPVPKPESLKPITLRTETVVPVPVDRQWINPSTDKQNELPLRNPTRIPYREMPRRRIPAINARKPSSGDSMLSMLRKKEAKKRTITGPINPPDVPATPHNETEDIKKLELKVQALHSGQNEISSLLLPRSLRQSHLIPVRAQGETLHVQSIDKISSVFRGKSLRIDTPTFNWNKAAVITVEKVLPSTRKTTETSTQLRPKTKTVEIFNSKIKAPTKNSTDDLNQELNFERDKKADNARIETAKKIWASLVNKFQGKGKNPQGKDLTDALPENPPEALQSELVKGRGGDGSFDEYRYKFKFFKKVENIALLAKRLTDQFPAVKKPKPQVRSEVTPSDVARVLRRKNWTNELQAAK
jgi:hypothetical protein